MAGKVRDTEMPDDMKTNFREMRCAVVRGLNAAFGGRHSEGVNYCDAAGGIHFLPIYSETQVKAAIEGKAPAEDQE